MTENVEYSVAGGVATIRLNRPDAMNALDAETAKQLAQYARKAELDPAVRCVVLEGAGRNFSGGGDVKVFGTTMAMNDEDRRSVYAEILVHTHALMLCIRRMPKPVIAAVNGAAAGVGLGLIAACDMAVAADDASFSLAFCRIGISPDSGMTYFLPRAVGLKKATELVLLGDRFDVSYAVSIGLVNRVVPRDALAAEIATLAKRLASGPTAAHACAKALLHRSPNAELADQLAAEHDMFLAGVTTHDFVEGVTAFLEKRPATFKGF